MKADLTRSTFRRERHYASVRMQQGRVGMDADWNEQADIETYLDETTRIDVIGGCGFPIHAAGFGLSPTPDGRDLALSPGRGYVDGILIENDAEEVALVKATDTTLELASVVPDGRELEAGEWLEIAGVTLVRVTKVDAASLGVEFEGTLDPATVPADAQVRRAATLLTQPDPPGAAALPTKQGLYLVYLDVWRRQVTALEDGYIREVALGGPDTATRAQTIWQVRVQQLDDEKATCATLPDWDSFIDLSTGALRARAQPETTSADLCTIPPGAGYRRLENQLYRVEVHDGGDLGSGATFKWSRENGSVVVAWLARDTDRLTVSTTGRDDVLGIGPGDWVELTDDDHELAGEPGTFVKVVKPQDGTLFVDTTTATGSLDIADFPVNPKARRWDDPDGLRDVEQPGGNDGYLALEDGVEVRFEDGHYNTGDYWLIPARTAHGDVEWPRDSALDPLARPREGIVHHYCALGLAQFARVWKPVADCRHLFPPLTEVTGGGDGAIDRMRVLRVSTHGRELRNDTVILPRELATGIDILCDHDVEPDTVEGKPTCYVTLDLPFPLNDADRKLWGAPPVAAETITLDALPKVQAAQILWRAAPVTQKWIVGRLQDMMNELQLDRLLVRLTVKGNVVYAAGQPGVNLDGEAFGRLSGTVLDVDLPSGDGRRGGDLELWLWLSLRPDAPPPTGLGVVLAVPARSSRLRTQAAQRAVLKAIDLAASRERLREALPQGYELSGENPPDPAQARKVLARLRSLARGGPPALLLTSEDALARLAEALAQDLRDDGVLDLQVASHAAFGLETLAAAQPDLVLVGADTLARVEAESPDVVAESITL